MVTYHINVTLPEGTTPSLKVTHVLPAGMTYVPGSAAVSSTSFGGTLPVPTITALGGNGDDVIFNFGTVTVNPDNVTGNNSFEITLQAVTGNVITNQSGATLNAQSDMQVLGTAGATSTVMTASVVEPALSVSKTPSISNPHFGQVVTFTINVKHATSTNADAFDLNLSDTIPTGLTYVAGSALGSGWTIDDTGAPTLSFTRSTFAIGTTSTITYQAQTSAPGGVNLGDTKTNSVDLTWTSLPGIDANERTGAGGINNYLVTSSTSVIVSGSDLMISKTDHGISAVPGQTIVYSVNYANQGNAAATGVIVRETVPNSTTFASGASSVGWSCANGSIGGTICDRTIGTLDAQTSSTLLFATTIQSPAISGLLSVTNTVQILDDGTTGVDPTPSNRSATDTTPIIAAPDLVVVKTASSTQATPGSTIIYHLRYGNDGNKVATGVVIHENIPTGTTFSSTQSSVGWLGCVNGASSGTCTYNISSLTTGATSTIDFAVTVANPLPAGQSAVTNTASIQDDEHNGTDPVPGNNSSSLSLSTSSSTAPEYAVSITDNMTQTGPSNTTQYVVTVFNNGNIGGTGVNLTVHLPTSINFSSADLGGTATSTASETIVSWPLFSLAGGGTGVVYHINGTVDSSVTNGLIYTATSTVSDDGANGADSNLSNNTATDQTNVIISTHHDPEPPGGGGGPTPTPTSTPTPTPVPVTTTSTTPIPVSPTTIIPVITPPIIAPVIISQPTCTLDCSKISLHLQIVNPNGTVRDGEDPHFVKKTTINANTTRFSFEDKGDDMDFNDVIIDVTKTDCKHLIVKVISVDAAWHHTIQVAETYDGKKMPTVVLSRDSHSAIGQMMTFDATFDAQMCRVLPPKATPATSCTVQPYLLKIVNPDGTVRVSGTNYVREAKLANGNMQYAFEDKGVDFDYNDVVVEAVQGCNTISFTILSHNAKWHHQIIYQPILKGASAAETVLWRDDTVGLGETRSVTVAPATTSSETASAIKCQSLPRVVSPLSSNETSPSVNNLQQKLSCLGFLHVTPNGTFGPATLSAVKAFQASVNPPNSGRVGTATAKALNAK